MILFKQQNDAELNEIILEINQSEAHEAQADVDYEARTNLGYTFAQEDLVKFDRDLTHAKTVQAK